MNLGTIKKTNLKNIKSKIKLQTRELKIGAGLSLLFFEIGSEPYYIKVIH